MFKDEFIRVRLSREGLADAEGDFYMARVVQPHRTGTQFCTRCWLPMTRFLANTWQCKNGACRNFRRPVAAGPVRGVVKVALRILIQNDQPVINCRLTDPLDMQSAMLPDDRISAVLLMLDRRYDQKSLEGVYRAAAALCEDMGWEVA